MPVSPETYDQIIRQEMRRGGGGGRRAEEAGQSARDAAVRRANIQTGYGNSTARKYPPPKRGGSRGGDTRDGGGAKAAPSGGKKSTVVDDNMGDLPKETSAIPQQRPDGGGIDLSALAGAGGIAGLMYLLSRYLNRSGGDVMHSRAPEGVEPVGGPDPRRMGAADVSAPNIVDADYEVLRQPQLPVSPDLNALPAPAAAPATIIGRGAVQPREQAVIDTILQSITGPAGGVPEAPDIPGTPDVIYGGAPSPQLQKGARVKWRY